MAAILIPRDMLPIKGGPTVEWARNNYNYRFLFNRGIGQMSTADIDVKLYQQEVTAYKKDMESRAKAKFNAVLVEEVRRRSDAWKMKLGEGQSPTSKRDIVKIVTSQEWISSVDMATVEEAIAYIAIGLFVSPGDTWVADAERDELRRLGVAGYKETGIDGAREGKGCISKIIKRSASESWKKTINTGTKNSLGWYVGARDESKKFPDLHFDLLTTSGGFRAYKVKTRASLGDGSGSYLHKVRVAIMEYLEKGGGTMESIEEMVKDLKKNGK